MSEEEFVLEVGKLGFDLSLLQKKQFKDYCDFLLEYNSHTNLTAIRNRNDVYLKHFYDSLLLLKFYSLENMEVLDIGSGAGFPGVPLKIIIPSINLSVLDSNGKKTTFLEKLKDVLKLDYTVINDRAESYIKGSREKYDVVISRAVTQMPILAEISLPFVKVGGYFIPYKANIDESIEGGLYAIDTLGGVLEKIESVNISKEIGKRTLLFVNKKCKTDEKYPRQFDKISKKPLQNSR